MIGYGSIECPGHNIVDQTVRPQEDKVRAVRDAPRPTTKRQMKSFLGLAGSYRRFIPNFSSIASPLTDLTKRDRPNSIRDWQDQHEKAFQTLKNRLTSSPILRLPVFQNGMPFVLRTDASDVGIGAVLLQEFEGEGRLPIAYASKKLLPRERNYSVIEKECLAIIWGVEKFRKYLYGVEFLLETDHKPLSYMQTAKVLNPRIMRWAWVRIPLLTPMLHIEVRLPVLLCAVKTVEGDFRFCWTITPNVGQTHKENPNLVRILYMVCTLNDIYKQYNKLHEH